MHKVDDCVQAIWKNGNDSQCGIPTYPSTCCLLTKRTHLSLGSKSRDKHFTQQGNRDPSTFTKPPLQSISSLWEVKKGHGHQLTLTSLFQFSGERSLLLLKYYQKSITSFRLPQLAKVI